MRHFLHFFTFLLIPATLIAQKPTISQNTTEPELHTESRLVVGIVVDQMRYDYLTRFWNRFGDDGFKRLVREGFNLKNNHFNYIPTYTGPGHASIFTGAAPKSHGIIGNNWYDKFEQQSVYCAGDPDVESVGTTSSAGKMSPHRMITTSIADENRLHTQMRGKTIGVGMKDRGAVLPAGHTANAAYWFHGEDEGKWISSSFYMDYLPQWVQNFNNSGKAESYFQTWNTLYDIEAYEESGPDENNFEGGFAGKATATFPYDLEELRKENNEFEMIKNTPFGNNLTTDFAIAALDGEQLGKDEHTDFFTVSYSSTDYIGHNFGVNSKEIQDTYLRLDRDLARLLKALDEKVGKGNYTLFLTSDHGGVHVPAYLESVKIPSGYFDFRKLEQDLNTFLAGKYQSESLIENISNNQIFLDYDEVLRIETSSEDIQQEIAHFLLQYDRINRVFTRSQLQSTSFHEKIAAAVDHGFNQKRSGDIMMVLDPSVISYSRTGSTHGTGNNYDTHAPLIFYGRGIKAGNSLERTEIVDIAPTISALLGIAFPNGATGRPLFMVFDN